MFEGVCLTDQVDELYRALLRLYCWHEVVLRLLAKNGDYTHTTFVINLICHLDISN